VNASYNNNFILHETNKKPFDNLTEAKSKIKSILNHNNITNLNISNATEKKNLKILFGVPSPKDNIKDLNSSKNQQQLNQSMNTNNINNNMNISKINVYNKMSISLNLINEEEEKISTKDFICLALLGRGSFGEVYLVQKINNKKKYAMKVLRKERIMGQNLSRYALAERNILSLSNHPFIVKLNYAFQSMTKLFLILEYCPGGDLAKHLRMEKKFEEKRAKFYLCEILLALEDLHKRNIIFRDLKPDNVVLDNEGHCKLTDFGLSKEGINNDQYTKSFCGSIAYLAPEVLKKQGHGKAVDWYLLGVLLYEMLTGETPYYDKNKNTLFYNIEHGNLTFPNYVSNNAKNLLTGLLQKDPKKRLGGGSRDAEEIKEHIFFEDVDWNKVYEKKIIPPKAMKINNNMFLFNKPKNFADEKKLEEIFGDNSLQGWTFINKDEM
jgi:serine/threonine protein kinase